MRVRKAKRPSIDNRPTPDTETSTQKCSKTDSYGCVNWQPLGLPEGQTPESVEEKRKTMVTLFTQEGPQAAERGQAKDLMKDYLC